MSTMSHPPTGVVPERSHHSLQLLVTEMWASLAIVGMWIAVAVSAVWGPDFVSTSPGGNSTTVPSGIAVALFASIGTWALAKYDFARHRKDADRPSSTTPMAPSSESGRGATTALLGQRRWPSATATPPRVERDAALYVGDGFVCSSGVVRTGARRQHPGF